MVSSGKIGPASSFFVAGSGIGSAGGFALGAMLGIKGALYSVAIAHVILIVFWLIIGGEGEYKVERPEGNIPKEELGRVYRSKNLWFVIIAYSLAMTASMTLNSYLINAFIFKGLDPGKAVLMGTVLNICLLVGGFVMTAVLSIVKRFNPLFAISIVGGGLFVLLSWFIPLGGITWVLIGLGGLFFGGSLGLCIARVPLLPTTGDFSPMLIGTANGFVETIKGLLSFVLPLAITYTLGTNFNGVFIAYAVCCGVAFLAGSLLLPELGQKKE